MKILLVLIVATLSVGCTAVKQGSKEAVNLATVNRLVTSGDVSKTIKTVELSNFETAVVTRAENHYIHVFLPKWKEKLVGIKASDPIFNEFENDYNLLKIHFENVKKVVIDNWNEYGEAEKILLKDNLRRAELADESAQRAIKLKEYHNALLDSFQVSKFILETASVIIP